MSTDLRAVIEIDDNGASSDAPFSVHPSMWNLLRDMALSGQKDYRFIAAISGYRRLPDDPDPLIPLRGLPPPFLAENGKEIRYETRAVLDFVADSSGWLLLDEIYACLKHYGVTREEIYPHTNLVLDVMEVMAKYYGRDRVRLVFGISG